MHIPATRRTATGATVRTSRPATSGGASFQVLQTSAQGAPPLAGAANVAQISSLIALQSAEGADERRRRAVGQGRALLDALDDMKLELLSGGPLASNLAHLECTLAQAEAAASYDGDACLKNVLDQILLRARVELAKLRKSAA